MSDSDATPTDENGDEIPHPDDCDHRWDLKGGTQSGSRAVTLWQCKECGLARSKSLTSGYETQDLNNGWNPNPVEEPDEQDDQGSSGLFGGLLDG